MFNIIQTTNVWTNSSGTSNNFSWSRAPTKNCLLISTADAPLASYAVTQTGYEWQPRVASAPTSAYGDAIAWVGKPTGREAPGTLLNISGLSFYNAWALEIDNFEGQVLWSNINYNVGTSITLPGVNATSVPMKNVLLDPDLWLFTAGRMKSGGSGVTSITSTGVQLTTLGNAQLGQVGYGRYVPGSSPTIVHTFSRSTNCSAFIIIMR